MKQLLFLLLLTGCSTTVPVRRTFPEVPSTFLSSCKELQQIPEEKTQLSDILMVVVDNYSIYHECSIKISGWIEWYNTQKKIFEEIKDN